MSIAAQPGASRTEAVGTFDGCLKLRLQAPPIDGRANEALIEWVARQIGIPRSAVTLTAGDRSRRKRLQLRCELDGPTISARLYQGERP